MKGFEIISASLAGSGVSAVFGVAGDANLYLIDDLVRVHGVRYIPAAHEGAATMMALGYARTLGRVGVATTTHGPGFTNTFTALVEGVRSSTSMVLLAGDTDPADRDHPQNIDQREVVKAAGAGFEVVRSLRTAPRDVSRAIWRAQTEERPIVLDVPIQLQWAEDEYVPSDWARPTEQAIAPDAEALDRAVGLIASARFPIIVAGRGALGARDALVRLAASLGAPLATTALGSNLFRGEPFDLGFFGTLSHPGAAEAIAQADCIITFGASLSTHTTDAGRLMRGKRIVQCDVRPAAFGGPQQSDVAVLGDARRTAEIMIEWLGSIDHTPSDFCTPELRDRLASRAWVGDHRDLGTDANIDPRVLTAALDDALPQERTVTVDVGRFMLYALTMPVPEPLALVTTHGFQSIGLGAAAAVGAGVARPDRPVVLLTGDGGYMMGGLAEFQTAVRCGLDLIVVVYNDGSYGAEHIQLYRKGMDPAVSLIRWAEFSDVATALGGEGFTVRSNEDLAAMADRIKNRDRPLLIDCKLDPDVMSALMG
jgi:thiamine pyrophosphate-dependent acetolactate synthase large subunit-like protein